MKFLAYSTVFSDNLSILDKLMPSQIGSPMTVRYGLVSADNKLIKSDGSEYGQATTPTSADEDWQTGSTDGSTPLDTITGVKITGILNGDKKITNKIPHLVYLVTDGTFIQKDQFAELIFDGIRPFGGKTLTKGVVSASSESSITVGGVAYGSRVFNSKKKSAVKDGRAISASSFTCSLIPGVNRFGTAGDVNKVTVVVKISLFTEADRDNASVFAYEFDMYCRRPNFFSVALDNSKVIGWQVEVFKKTTDVAPFIVDNVMLHGTTVALV